MRDWLTQVLTKAQSAVAMIPAWLTAAAWVINDRFLTLVSEGYKRNAVAYACVRLLATSVPEAALRIVQPAPDGDVEQVNHPVRALIARPNPLMSEFEFWELVTTHLSICGRSLWWKERDHMNRTMALWPLRPDRVSPIYGAGVVEGWEYRLDGQTYRLPREDVLLFNLPDPGADDSGIVAGLGPLQVLAREVDADNAATSFVYSLVSNYAMPGTLIKTKSKLTKEVAEKLVSQFAQKFGDVNRGRPIVIDADSDITPLSFSLSTLEFPDLRAVAEARIAAVIGVPAILVGLKVGLDRATFANMAEAREFFAETTLAVYWRRLSDQITLDLLAEYDPSGTLVARFDTSQVKALAHQRAEQIKPVADGFKAGVVTVNEYRKALGLAPDPAGECYLRSRAASVYLVGKTEPVLLPAPAGTGPGTGDAGEGRRPAASQAAD